MAVVHCCWLKDSYKQKTSVDVKVTLPVNDYLDGSEISTIKNNDFSAKHFTRQLYHNSVYNLAS